jgi:glycosyltransferase involved in cell wall biosynthesis
MSRLLGWASKLPRGFQTALKSLPGASYLRMLAAGTPALAGPGRGELRAVVYLPTWLRWEAMHQRPQYLLESFARAGHPVYFVDPREEESRVVDGVRIVGSLRDVPQDGVILYVHFAPVRRMFRLFDDPVVVYDILDDLSIYERSEVGMPKRSRVAAHHPGVMERADVVIVSNEVLLERYGRTRPDVMLVPNGVDVERFSTPAPKPDDLPAGPIVGYHGAIAPWFDFELFTRVATSCPDVQFVLVGPVDPEVTRDADRVAGLPNAHVVGERSSGSMPGYVQAFDVGAIWFKVNQMTRGVTPLKMYECRAAGTPCVATPLPACVAEDGVTTADTAESFIGAIRNALARSSGGSADPSIGWDARLAPVLERLAALGLGRVR